MKPNIVIEVKKDGTMRAFPTYEPSFAITGFESIPSSGAVLFLGNEKTICYAGYRIRVLTGDTMQQAEDYGKREAARIARDEAEAAFKEADERWRALAHEVN